MWLLFVLLGLAFGALLLVLGLVAAVVGVVVAAVHALPLLLILAGAWLLFRATRGSGRDARRDSDRDRRAEASRPSRHQAAPRDMARRPVPSRPVGRQSEDQRPVERSGGEHTGEPAAPVPRPEAGPRRELPIDVRVKVEQIRHKADVLLGYADRFQPYSQDLHIVRQTAAEYLPRTVRAYLALPGDDDPVVGAGGKTALQELREQLGLMDAKLDQITQALQRNDLDRMLANRRFLEERFDVRASAAQADAPARGTDAA